MSTPWIAQEAVSLDMAVGERVHQLMWRAKISQTTFAPKLGLSQAGLSKKLRGERSWSLDEVVAVARIFEISLSDLLAEPGASGPTMPVNPPPTD